MPIVTIQLMEGRPPERIQAMMREVSRAIAETLDAPIETVRVMVNEMQDHQYAVGGRPVAEVKAERARLAAEQHQQEHSQEATP